MRKLTLALLLFAASVLLAQPPASARVTFEQRWPTRDPQWFELLVQPDGTTKYRSLPLPDPKAPADDPPEPYELTFTLSPQSRDFIFALAPRLNEFQPTLDKSKVAFTGTKTFRYEVPASAPSSISYNFSSSPELTRLTALLQGVSETVELSRSLQFQLRFDKLALDSSLRRAEELVSSRQLSERQILSPILTRIANDPAIMNIARQRARRILQAPTPAKLK
jgi:hypothetical protein